jgi:predicted RNase H-like nuclease (RuvC/YqgF family)
MSNPTSDVIKLKREVEEQRQLLEAKQGEASIVEMGRQDLMAEQVKLDQQISHLKTLIRQQQVNFNQLDRRVSGFTEKERLEEPVKVKRMEKQHRELQKHIDNYRERIANLTDLKKTQKDKINQMEQQGIEMMMTNKSHEIHLRSLQGSLVQAKLAAMQAGK